MRRRILPISAFLLLWPPFSPAAGPSLQGGPGPILRPISYQDFVEVEKKDPYYKGRWSYFSLVIDLIEKAKPASVLELGPFRLPLVKGADTMDVVKVLDRLTYFHDATKIPWPIQDGKYDLFIACEVWEHLGNRQKEAFREVRRIARRALFSFPYKWKYPPGSKDEEALSHADIDEGRIAAWTQSMKPKTVVFSKDRKFVVYYFEFDH